jgi:hypothetical protein
MPEGEEHFCTELRAEKIMVWCAKRPHVFDNELHPLYRNHRAYRVIAKGEGGRPAYARVETPWRVIDREALRRAVGMSPPKVP